MAITINAPDSVKKHKESKVSELNTVLVQIRKEKGDKVAVVGSSIPQTERVPTGMFEFDLAIGGGFPKGRYSIVYGPEGSGKTNLCYLAVANAQKSGGYCNKAIWIDLEGTFDPKWAKQFGVDVDELIVVKPSYGEECVDLVDALVRADDVAILVLDSLAVVTSTKELEQSAEKFDVGTSAILVKRMCNKLVNALSEESKRDHTPAVILINQTRFKIGVMFGDPETIPGGQTMKFLSSLTIRLYGKNKVMKEISPDLAAFKETNVVVKKAKVPVFKNTFEYNMCLFPHETLKVGDTDSWNKVVNELKQIGELEKESSGWKLFGESYTTQVQIQEKYENDHEYMIKVQSTIIDSYKGKAILVEAEGLLK